MVNGFEQRLISVGGCRYEGEWLVLEVRLPWYRSLPLSTVEISRLAIDGEDVPVEGVQLQVNGRRFPATGLNDLVDEWWFVLDSGYLYVKGSGPGGAAPQIDLTLNLYPPYIPGLTWVTRAQASLS